MTVSEEQFQELLSIVDKYADKKHSLEGTVSESLRAVLQRHASMLTMNASQEARLSAEAIEGKLALNDMSERERAAYMAALPSCSALEMVRLCLTWLASEVVNHRQNHDPACNCGWDMGVLSAVNKIRDELLISGLGLPIPPGSPQAEWEEQVKADMARIVEPGEDEVSEEEFDAIMATGETVEIVGTAAAEAEEPEGGDEE